MCKLYHLGVGVVTRSSLARVNAEKPWEMYEELHGRLLGRCQAKAPGHGYRFKAKLFSVDSTTIDLCLSAFPWAKFRRTKGAVKVHVGLDHEGYLPKTLLCEGPGEFQALADQRMARLTTGCGGSTIWPDVSVAARGSALYRGAV